MKWTRSVLFGMPLSRKVRLIRAFHSLRQWVRISKVKKSDWFLFHHFVTFCVVWINGDFCGTFKWTYAHCHSRVLSHIFGIFILCGSVRARTSVSDASCLYCTCTCILSYEVRTNIEAWSTTTPRLRIEYNAFWHQHPSQIYIGQQKLVTCQPIRKRFGNDVLLSLGHPLLLLAHHERQEGWRDRARVLLQ